MPVSRTKKLVFFGTPAFAVPTLDALEAAGRTPLLVVTQPAKPAGRGQEIQEPPVAVWARERGIEVAQPASLKDEAFLERLEEIAPDVAVVVAYGKIFPPRLLELPRHGCVNLHASLLPRYRGASPIQAALLHGEKKTGMTTMRMEEELDAGPILLQEEVPVLLHETAGELTERLAPIGGLLVVATLEQLDLGKLKERKQRDESVSYARQIVKEDGRADWALSAEELYNRVRAFDPWPGVHAHFRNQPVKLVWGVPMDWEDAPIGATGTFLGLRQGRIAVLAGDGTIFGIEELQRPGKKVLRASDFANGERMRVGERFA
jgi:methionyl-tRNA formyltransferase